MVDLVPVVSEGSVITAKAELAPKPRYILGLEELGGYEFKQDTILRDETVADTGFLSGLPGFWGWVYFFALVDRLDVIVNTQFPEILEDYVP